MADRTIRVILEAVIGGYRTAMQQASQSTRDFGAQVVATSAMARKNSESFTIMGAAAAGAGAAIFLGLGVSGKAAMEFESSFAGVRKTVEATESEFSSLEDTFRQMATEIPVSVNELNRIAELGGQMGVAAGDLADFTKTVAILGATIDGLSVEDAAMAIARFAGIMELPAEEFGNVGATVVDLGNKFKATEGEILEMSVRMAAAGKIAGLSASDVLAFATTLSDVGVEAEAGGTAMSKAFTKIASAVADGGEDLEEFAQVADMSGEAFASMFREDPAKAIASFISGLRQVREEGGNVFAVVESLGLSEERLKRALLSTAEAEGLLTTALGVSSDAFEEGNAHLTEAEKRFKTFESRLEVAKNKVEDAKISLGNLVLRGIVPAAEAVGSLAEGVAELPAPLQAAAVGTGVLAGATLVLAGASLLVLPRISGMIEGYQVLRPAIDGARLRMMGATDALGGMTGAMGNATVSAGNLSGSLATIGGVAAAALAGAGIGTLIEKNITTPLAEAAEQGSQTAQWINRTLGAPIEAVAIAGRLAGGASFGEAFDPAGHAAVPLKELQDQLTALHHHAGFTQKDGEAISGALRAMTEDGTLTEEAIGRLSDSRSLSALRDVVETGGDVDATIRAIASGDYDFGATKSGIEGIGEAMSEVDEETRKAAESIAKLAISFERLRDSQLGTTAADDIAGLNDQLATARERLADLRSGGDTSDIRKRIDENQRYLVRTPERDEELAEAKADLADATARRKQEIASIEADIAGLEKKLATASMTALEQLQVSTKDNAKILGQWYQDVAFLASSGQELLAGELYKMGPTSADAAHQAAEAVKSGEGLGSLPEDIKTIFQTSLDLAELEKTLDLDSWPDLFYDTGMESGRAFAEGFKGALDTSGSLVLANANAPSNYDAQADPGSLFYTAPAPASKRMGYQDKHGGGLAQDEGLYVLQHGELVIDRDTTKALLASARMHDGGVAGSVPSLGGRDSRPHTSRSTTHRWFENATLHGPTMDDIEQQARSRQALSRLQGERG